MKATISLDAFHLNFLWHLTGLLIHVDLSVPFDGDSWSCDARSPEQVLLQVSNSASLTSATALRLRRRLAADPTLADRAAEALGIWAANLLRMMFSP